MASSQQQAKSQLSGLLRSRLVEIDTAASQLFGDYSRRLKSELHSSDTVIERLREMRRRDPIVRQGIFVSPDGLLLYPERPDRDDPEAIALYAALPGMISGHVSPDGGSNRNQLRTQGDNSDAKQSSSKFLLQNLLAIKQRSATKPGGKTNSVSTERAPTKGAISAATAHWQVWYMDQGVQLIHWQPRDNGALVGVLLERSRWTSDLTARLPETQTQLQRDSSTVVNSLSGNKTLTGGFTALVNESNQVVYRWGDEGSGDHQPLATIAMSPPLSAWKWEFHSTASLVPAYSTASLFLSLVGIGICLVGLGAYVLTSVQRQMRTAASRVSFAGQVSHELRTPLTNIRLYAELAQSDLESPDHELPREKIAQRLSVIDSESKRLGRLVSGVLEMIRHGKSERGPRLASHQPDQLIDEILDQFQPSFSRAEIEVHRDLSADEAVQLDADIFDMVLVNLLSNVEKYAPDGKSVTVRSLLDANELIVTVSDQGPGISARNKRKVFQAFSRLDDSINAPSGTGIGLTIARNAAQRHGGSLELIPSDQGACFELRIPIQPPIATINNANDVS
jgi:signal transduction histidine kinase